MLFHFGCVSVSSSVWKFVYLCVLSCIYCRTSYVVSLWVCVSEFIWMKVCMFECLVLYIMSYVLCCFILGVCQWVHLYESLYVWVSCPVYIVERLMLFHYRCVSVSSSVWKFVRLCVLSCICCRTSYVVSSWVCVSEFIWMKVCMIVCLVLYMLSNVLCCFIMGVCQWVHLNESLYDCVSCPVYVVERLMLFQYGCVSVSSSVWKFVFFVCLVLYMLSNVLCCFIMGVCQWVHCMKVCIFVCLVLYMLSNVLCCFNMGACQWVHLNESLYICVSCPVYVVERLMLFHHGCVSVN